MKLQIEIPISAEGVDNYDKLRESVSSVLTNLGAKIYNHGDGTTPVLGETGPVLFRSQDEVGAWRIVEDAPPASPFSPRELATVRYGLWCVSEKIGNRVKRFVGFPDDAPPTQAEIDSLRERLSAAKPEPRTCILTGADGENPDDCTTHNHEPAPESVNVELLGALQAASNFLGDEGNDEEDEDFTALCNRITAAISRAEAATPPSSGTGIFVANGDELCLECGFCHPLGQHTISPAPEGIEVTFENVTITLTAPTPSVAYDRLGKHILALPGFVAWESDTFTAADGSDESDRDTSELQQ